MSSVKSGQHLKNATVRLIAVQIIDAVATKKLTMELNLGARRYVNVYVSCWTKFMIMNIEQRYVNFISLLLIRSIRLIKFN